MKKTASEKKYGLINQDKLELPFKNNSFDYILSADVLEHVGYDNQKIVVSEMFRVLKMVARQLSIRLTSTE